MKKNFQVDDGCVLYLPSRKRTTSTWTDFSKSGNNGTVYGAATPPAATPGALGYTFDGVDDYVDVGNKASVQITGTFTIETWIKGNSFTSNRSIVQKYDAGGSERGFTMYFTDGILQLVVSSTPTPFTGAIRVSATTLTTGNWYHIVTVFSPSANQDIYVNGVLDNGDLTGTIQSSIANPTRNLTIGANYNNSTTPNIDFFNGIIDGVRIYNRALSQGEITALFGKTRKFYGV